MYTQEGKYEQEVGPGYTAPRPTSSDPLLPFFPEGAITNSTTSWGPRAYGGHITTKPQVSDVIIEGLYGPTRQTQA